MAETRRKFDRDFKEGAVRLVRETGRPLAEVARDLGINEGTLGNWVNADRRRRGDGTGPLDEDERAELARLRKENAELVPAAGDGHHHRVAAARPRRRHARHGRQAGPALFDLSSSWLEGTRCPLAARGYSRDGKKGRLQIEYGLLTDPAGRATASAAGTPGRGAVQAGNGTPGRIRARRPAPSPSRARSGRRPARRRSGARARTR